MKYEKVTKILKGSKEEQTKEHLWCGSTDVDHSLCRQFQHTQPVQSQEGGTDMNPWISME